MKHNYFKHLFTTLLLLCTTVATAHDFEVDGIYYKITNTVHKTVAVTYKGSSYNSYSNEYFGDLLIPNSVSYNETTYSVTSITSYAFYGCTELMNVEIPNSVNSIGEDAFYNTGWYNNQSEGLLYLSSWLIGYKRETPSGGIEIADNTRGIADYAFDNCNSLEYLVIPNTVRNIGNYAFYSCRNLIGVSIPKSVISIGEKAFFNTAILNNQVDGIYYLNGWLLGYDTNKLTNELVIADGTKKIANGALANSSITSVSLPNSIEFIGKRAFTNCTALKAVYINDLTAWCNIDFESYDSNPLDCAKYLYLNGGLLTELAVPNDVTEIKKFAFTKCWKLTKVIIPGSVTSIGMEAFYACHDISSLILESGITSIGYGAFRGGLGKITSIEIPATVVSIGEGAFGGCSGLTSIDIPNNVKSIGKEAFSSCSALIEVKIPNSVKEIGEGAFQYCSKITKVTSLIAIDELYAINTNVFNDVNKEECVLCVPAGAKDVYSSTDGWSDFLNIIESPSYKLTVTSAGYATLYLDKAVEIPAGVEVYTANSIDGEYLKMQLIENAIPANTGTIVKADADTYIFPYVDYEVPVISNNLLKGTVANEYITVPTSSNAYVLSIVDGEVGMYLAELVDSRFLNNANKAYLLLRSNGLNIYDDKEIDTSAGGQLSNGYRLDFGGITIVDDVKTEIGEINAIYDLQGRKVTNPTNGIYIINGKKVLVK